MTITNQIAMNRRSDFTGYTCYRLSRGRDGKIFDGSKPKYVIFYHGRLVCECGTIREANELFLSGAMDGYREDEYLGLGLGK